MPKQSLERKKASFSFISSVHLIDKGKVGENLFWHEVNL